MAKEGIPFILIAVLLVAISGFFSVYLAVPFVLILAFVLYFFRDPNRIASADPKTLVSPADGLVVEVHRLDQNPFLEGPVQKIGIFMSPFDVHVNRIPIDGTIEKIDYRPGKFLIAKREKASEDNERNAVFLKMETGQTIVFVQIAGFIARRIVWKIREGDQVKKGERFGMIRFGSRMDVYLPVEFSLEVSEGQRMRAGETVIAKVQ